LVRADGAETRRRIKVVAQRLFAERGIDGVSVQEILGAAGQRNRASLQYHFGSKEALIAELVVDGAQWIDARRNQLLDEIEVAAAQARESGRRGSIPGTRAYLYAWVLPVLDLSAKDDPEAATYIRFVANLQLTHRALLRSALDGKWNSGYKRCLDRIAELISDVPKPLLEQRISILGIFGNAFAAAREHAMDRTEAPHPFWSRHFTADNIVDMLEAALRCKPSAATLRALGSAGVREGVPGAISGEEIEAR